MLQLVKIALLRPLTFVVMAILIVLFGSIAWIKTPTDIFPDIKVPVIAAVDLQRPVPQGHVGPYHLQLRASVDRHGQ
jgi:Cu/Ag efflux pump CusA